MRAPGTRSTAPPVRPVVKLLSEESVRTIEQTPGIPRAHVGRGDACDPQLDGRARLSGQPERSCVLATTTVWPMKCKRVKRCLLGGVQNERLVCLDSWCLITYVVCLGAEEVKEVKVLCLSHIVLIS